MGKKILAAIVVTMAGAGMVYGAAAPGGGPGGGGMGGGPGGAGGGRGGRGGARGGAPANLGGAMRDMGATYKTIKGEYADASKADATIKDLSTMERDIAVAKADLPDKVKAMTGDAQVKATKEFRGMMLKLLTKFVALEQAVTDNKADDAKAALADIDKLMDAGHKEFMDQQ